MADGADLTTVLRSLCAVSTAANDAAMGSALTLVEDMRVVATTCDDPLVLSAEHLQHRVGEGPTMMAVRDGLAVVSTALVADRAWPRLAVRMRRMQLGSVMAVPLTASGRIFGALSTYAYDFGAFDPADLDSFRQLATSVSALARSAQTLAANERQIAQLTEALRARPIIDQAIGIMRARSGRTESEALQRLRRISNEEHVKVVDLAERLVSEAVQRANALRRNVGNGDTS
ncbi:MAG TPA: GAF and ANTAR domain-containing protein [Jatrophihabitans sp.]|nr:GAF and ANTAR domain-containing protein [Jatrophihabitans sp.]